MRRVSRRTYGLSPAPPRPAPRASRPLGSLTAQRFSPSPSFIHYQRILYHSLDIHTHARAPRLNPSYLGKPFLDDLHRLKVRRNALVLIDAVREVAKRDEEDEEDRDEKDEEAVHPVVRKLESDNMDI